MESLKAVKKLFEQGHADARYPPDFVGMEHVLLSSLLFGTLQAVVSRSNVLSAT